MPEMPEIQALAERLDEVLAGGDARAARPAAVLVAEDVRAPARRGARRARSSRSGAAGKFVVIELDGGLRVLVPPLAGRPRRRRVAAEDDEAARRPCCGSASADRPSVLVKEFGTQRKAGWWVLARGRRRSAREARARRC